MFPCCTAQLICDICRECFRRRETIYNIGNVRLKVCDNCKKCVTGLSNREISLFSD